MLVLKQPSIDRASMILLKISFSVCVIFPMGPMGSFVLLFSIFMRVKSVLSYHSQDHFLINERNKKIE